MSTLPLFPTSLVGSYPQPDWLIDKAKLKGRFPPRTRAPTRPLILVSLHTDPLPISPGFGLLSSGFRRLAVFSGDRPGLLCWLAAEDQLGQAIFDVPNHILLEMPHCAGAIL